MIRNLNQMSFHPYGTVLAVRPSGEKDYINVNNSQVLDVLDRNADIYLLEEDVWIIDSKGFVILSVSLDGKRFEHFKLDKPVIVRAGVFVSLNSLLMDGAVNYSTKKLAKCNNTMEHDDFTIPRQLHVEQLYTFFYEEREQGFVFPGNAYPVQILLYVDQGSLNVVVDGKKMLLNQGDLVLISPNRWHMFYADIDVAPRFVSMVFELSEGDISSIADKKITVPQHTVTLLQRMLREQENKDPYSSDIIISFLNLLLLGLLREQAVPRGGRVQTSNAIHNENEIIRQAQKFISSHIRQKLSVPIVARHVDVSPSYLTALFHKNLQISPGEYIRRTKLQESKQMIRENNLNFTQIAAELQYSTVHHFSRQFKEKFGITPTEYAKSVR